MSRALVAARRRSTHLSVLVLAVLAYVPALMSSPGRMPADTKLYLYLDPARLTSDAPWTFDERQFAGWVPHQQITYLWPSGPWYWFWETIGAPDWLAHRLWLGTLFFLAGLGVRWLARTLGIGVPGALVAAVVYQLSPYILPYVSRTSLMLLPWAGLGWIVVLTARAATRSRWRDAAILALVIATVGSPNATALAMVAPAPLLWLVHAAWGRTITWRRAAETAAKVGVLAVGVSLWWITMLGVQGREGADVLAYSESLEAVSFTSTSSEVLRGLGYWLFYLRDAYAATTSASWDYLSSTGLVAIGYMLLAVCLTGLVATRWAHRRYALLLFAAGTLLAVGVHPLDDPAPLTDWLVGDTSSGLALALRSSTRAIPMATLGLALGAGALVAAARPGRSWGRALVPVAIVVLAVVNLPSLWRHDYVDPALAREQDPPAAWIDAATRLDSLPPGYRVLQLPGQEFGAYRWGYTVDQPLPGLTERPLVTRDLLPLGSPQTMDLVYALDDRFQDGVVEPQTIAPIARLFGADTVFVTNDTAFERFRTPRPEPTSSLFERRPVGLGDPIPIDEPIVNRPNVEMVDDESVTTPSVGQPVPPVMLVPVDEPIPVVRAKTVEAIVSGDGEGIVDAAAAGLLDGTELIRYSADLPAVAPEPVAAADSLIVTDTNRDRARRWNGSQDNVGFTESGGPGTDLLRAESADSRIPVFSNDDPSTQTTARQVGPVTAIATAYGEPFAYRPEDRAVMAIDGRVDTAWRVADRSPDAVGQSIRLDVARPVDHITLTQPGTAPRGRHITAVDVTVADRPAQRVELDPASMTEGQRIDIEPTVGPVTITITVAATATPTEVPGPALAAVGFAEIDVGLRPTTEVVSPPSDLLTRSAVETSDAPLSLVLTRWRYDASNRYRSDPEPSLVRRFRLPRRIESTPAVTARLSGRAPDNVLNDVLGIEAPVATDRVAGDPRAAGWATVDGDPATQWITPFGFVHGVGLEIPLSGSEPLTSFTITQPGGDEFNTITSVRVVAGDHDWILPVPVPDGGGTSTIELPLPVSGDELSLSIAEIEERVTIDRRYGEPVFLPAAISEISIGPRIELPRRLDLGCRSDLLSIDGVGVPVRLGGDTEAILDGEPFTVTPCPSGPVVSLGRGVHRVTSAYGVDTGVDVDRVVFAPGSASAARRPDGLLPAIVTSSSRTSSRIRVGPCPSGCWLVFGEGYSDSWSASAGDVDLGPPTPVDGGFNGWWIAPTDFPVEITVAWTAQGPVTFGLIASAVALVVALALIILDRRRLVASIGRIVDDGLVIGGRPVTPILAAVAGAAGLVTAALLIDPLAAVWIGAVAAVAVVTRRPRLAGYTALGVALYVGAATVYIVRRDRPYPNGAWLEHVEWLHPIGLSVVALVVIAAVGAGDDRDQPS